MFWEMWHSQYHGYNIRWILFCVCLLCTKINEYLSIYNLFHKFGKKGVSLYIYLCITWFYFLTFYLWRKKTTPKIVREEKCKITYLMNWKRSRQIYMTKDICFSYPDTWRYIMSNISWAEVKFNYSTGPTTKGHFSRCKL